MIEEKSFYPHHEDFLEHWNNKVSQTKGKTKPFTKAQLEAIYEYDKFLRKSLRLRVRSRLPLDHNQEVETHIIE